MADTIVQDSPSGKIVRRSTFVTLDIASVATVTAPDQSFTVLGVKPNDGYIVTPLGTWPAGLTLPQGRCAVADTLILRLCNPTAGAVDPGSQSFRIDMFRA